VQKIVSKGAPVGGRDCQSVRSVKIEAGDQTEMTKSRGAAVSGHRFVVASAPHDSVETDEKRLDIE
jgi:hypothetical protein